MFDVAFFLLVHPTPLAKYSYSVRLQNILSSKSTTIRINNIEGKISNPLQTPLKKMYLIILLYVNNFTTTIIERYTSNYTIHLSFSKQDKKEVMLK